MYFSSFSRNRKSKLISCFLETECKYTTRQKIKAIKIYCCCLVLNNTGFSMKEKFIRSNSVLVCMHFRIHRYVAAPLAFILDSKVQLVQAQISGVRRSIRRCQMMSNPRIVKKDLLLDNHTITTKAYVDVKVMNSVSRTSLACLIMI